MAHPGANVGSVGPRSGRADDFTVIGRPWVEAWADERTCAKIKTGSPVISLSMLSAAQNIGRVQPIGFR